MSESASSVYTVGRRDIYDPYIANDPEPGKRKGGSVWRYAHEADAYLGQHGMRETFGVYEVRAAWQVDTEPDPEGDGWHQLRRDADLVGIVHSPDCARCQLSPSVASTPLTVPVVPPPE